MIKIEEDLNHAGARIVALPSSWTFSFWLAGPDGRYRLDHIEFRPTDLDLLISAYTEGVEWYLASEPRVPR